ncbi:MarR family winged helix-turn-helix transcriptional regulator [Burkholderia vietnamiensis]|uniref:MarR family winged helix-turn-helix transcriptional regulator n=1 Tax=Burkholderia vietnamiensis TaxID=60552 RepID=UPI002651890A|nr:MarR family transcriptional regulator [Burkholderia vietnamiensis]MDN8037059.1 MarR family transcriptional regulator [Burkholderia vietnamiensis]
MSSRTKRTPAATQKKKEEELSTDLYEQPGHLIRRAHQISVSMFHEVLGPDITPIQYAALRILQDHPDIDQVTLAKYCALDNSTTANLAVRLGEKGLVERVTPPENKRVRLLRLSTEGAALLESLVPSVHELRHRMLQTLTLDEQETFLALLSKFVHINNEKSRAPLRRQQIA